MTSIKSIAFDLDDTLLDTTNLIVPGAVSGSYAALIKGGIAATQAEMETLRSKWNKQMSHKEIFRKIADTFALKNDQAVQEAIHAFYTPKVPTKLPLMAGALENLELLKKKYRLYLVTAGDLQTQQAKIKAMDIMSHFQDIYVIDGKKLQAKKDAFVNIIERDQIKAHQLLSVGNRLASEIRDAKLLGGATCYFAYGEHVGEVPEQDADRPDFTIHHHHELISTCSL